MNFWIGDRMAVRNHQVFLWILILCLMVMMMVIIGGVTRLTGSGLSMVEWQPLMGAIPPITQSDWLEVFHKYQTSPQYLLVNKGMELSEFQWIFFWEYFHRLIGRLIGVVFLIPWILFWWKGYFNSLWAGRLFVGFALGGLQGLAGWFMVASGLVDRPEVSSIRLAIHLMLAVLILAYFWRMAWHFYPRDEEGFQNRNLIKKGSLAKLSLVTGIESSTKIHQSEATILRSFLKSLNLLFLVLLLQIIYGAFVAGLRAGFMFNTFPDMGGKIIAEGAFALLPIPINLIENPILVQWIHRSLAWILIMGVLAVFFNFKRQLKPVLKNGLIGLMGIVGIQFLLGILTLIFRVPLPLAVSHQIGACLVLLYLLWLRWQTKENLENTFI